MYRKLVVLLSVFLALGAESCCAVRRLENCECSCNRETSNPRLFDLGSVLRGKQGPRGAKGDKGVAGPSGEDPRFEDLEKRLRDLEEVFARKVSRSCQDLQELGGLGGIQKITLLGKTVEVFCTEDGYTTLQRRFDGSQSFDQNFSAYVQGFGRKEREHWLGLRWMHEITRVGTWTLRVELENYRGEIKFAEYDDFKVKEGPQYRLQLGAYSGTAGDAMANNDGLPFSAKDRDMDSLGNRNCALDYFAGAWWYFRCGKSNLNAYRYGRGTGYDRMNWLYFSDNWDAIKSTHMKIIRTD